MPLPVPFSKTCLRSVDRRLGDTCAGSCRPTRPGGARWIAAGLTSAGLTATAFPASAAPKETIKLVSSLLRTGSARADTDGIVNAIRLAIAEYQGDVAGFRVQYLDWDDALAASGQWAAEQEAGNARKAIEDPDVVAVIGPYNSGAAKVSMPL
ncbi:MAG: hypothetical protein JWO38_7372, partial [Gemmataceae bacterium]|nr:hypothetical protein [Gemmataceae bacterium]